MILRREIMKLLNVEEVADLLRLKPSTIYKYTSGRKIPFIKRGKSIFFDEDDLKDWLNSMKIKAI